MENPRFEIATTKNFRKKLHKLVDANSLLEDQIIQILKILITNPFYSGLRTHKVQSKNYGGTYSSRITGNLRVIWNFGSKGFVIIILDIGGHSGSRMVYKK